MGSNGDQWNDCQHLNYFYNRIILVLLYRNDVNVCSGLVSMYMYFDIHSCETSLSTLRSQARLRNHMPKSVHCPLRLVQLFL